MAILLLLLLAWLDPGASFYIYGSSLGLPQPYTSLPPPNPYYHQVDQTQLLRNSQWQPLLPYSPLTYLYQPYTSVRTGWDYTFAKNPPRDIGDCVSYFYACTDFQEPGWPENQEICTKMFEYCSQYFTSKETKIPFLESIEITTPTPPTTLPPARIG